MTKDNQNTVLFIALLIGFASLLYFNGGAINQVPNIAVNTITGEKITMASLKGKPALITFWATDCPGCIKEIPHLKALHADYAAKGVNIIAIAMKHDRPDHVIAMTKDKELPYSIALDPMGEAAKAFGNVRLTPTTFLISPDSSIAMHKLGVFDEEKMRQQIDKLLTNS
ncbi:MAG: redoxin [Cycloclasticus sp. symbiont of Bathymodiolus heckerae]|nr:MAG: redoxin [Cycloclasticus sp. symbiont of Bathymodiolus heckerae]